MNIYFYIGIGILLLLIVSQILMIISRFTLNRSKYRLKKSKIELMNARRELAKSKKQQLEETLKLAIVQRRARKANEKVELN